MGGWVFGLEIQISLEMLLIFVVVVVGGRIFDVLMTRYNEITVCCKKS
jgi:hypothetical protein